VDRRDAGSGSEGAAETAAHGASDQDALAGVAIAYKTVSAGARERTPFRGFGDVVAFVVQGILGNPEDRWCAIAASSQND
jgi:hypothetical protein